MLDFDKIDLHDKRAYHLLTMGLTKGVFQLEEHLGERYSQIVKPKTIEDIADLLAIIRPGCKEAFHVDGETTMLNAYCKIRAGEMEEAYLHDDLKAILVEQAQPNVLRWMRQGLCGDLCAGSTA